MNILVINGSPKGEYSITLQTVLFLQKKHPGISFEILHAGQRIRSLEKTSPPLWKQSGRPTSFCFPIRSIRLSPPVSFTGLLS